MKRIFMLLVPALMLSVIVGTAGGATKPRTVEKLCGWVEKGGNKDTFNDFSLVKKHPTDARFCLVGVKGKAGGVKGKRGARGFGRREG